MEGVSNVPRVLVTPEVVKMGGDKMHLYRIQIALPDRRSGSVSVQHENLVKFHEDLKKQHSTLKLPSFPHFGGGLRTPRGSKALEKRKEKLESYLTHLLEHSPLAQNEEVCLFFNITRHVLCQDSSTGTLPSLGATSDASSSGTEELNTPRGTSSLSEMTGAALRTSKSFNELTQSRSSFEPPARSFSASLSRRRGVTKVRGVKSSDILRESTAVKPQKSGRILPKRTAHKEAKSLFFGAPLELSFTQCIALGLPHLTEMLIDFLRSTSLETKGLFRLPGDDTEVQLLRKRANKGKLTVEDLSESSAHSVASALKLYYRELPKPLICFSIFTQLKSCYQTRQSMEVEKKMSPKEIDAWYLAESKKIIFRLPQLNFMILKKLLFFLSEVASRSDVNMMTPSNLGTVFGPNLLSSSSKHSLRGGSAREQLSTTDMFKIMEETPFITSIIALLITKYQQVFENGDPNNERSQDLPYDSGSSSSDEGDSMADSAHSSQPAAESSAARRNDDVLPPVGELSALVIDPIKRARQLLRVVNEDHHGDSEADSTVESGSDSTLVSYEEKTRTGEVDLEEQDQEDFWSGSYHDQITPVVHRRAKITTTKAAEDTTETAGRKSKKKSGTKSSASSSASSASSSSSSSSSSHRHSSK